MFGFVKHIDYDNRKYTVDFGGQSYTVTEDELN